VTEQERTNGLLAGISERLIKALPPAMVVLVLLNIGTLGMVAYIFQHNSDARNALLTKIVENCLLRSPKEGDASR
jgi:hypothetical protein